MHWFGLIYISFTCIGPHSLHLINLFAMIMMNSQYKKEMGDTVVPQNSGRLGQWVHAQRVHYKKFKRGEKSQMNAERALKLSEIGFVFDAGDRFRGSNKMGGQPSQEEVAQVSEALNPPPLGGSFF